MVYNQKLAVAVKHNNKVLREDGETVFVPFGSEYSLLIKNLNNTLAVVKIEIDGTDATEGGLVVKPGASVDLERFLSDNLNSGNKFKFIEKTSAISDHRGDKIDDGLIRVSYQFEKPGQKKQLLWDTLDTTNLNMYGSTGGWTSGSSSLRSRGIGGQSVGSSGPQYSTQSLSSFDDVGEVYCSADATPVSKSMNEAGITVKGSESNQKFREVTVGELDSKEHVIVLQLKGVTETNKPVKEAVTVKSKKQCPSCGKKFNARNKFCPDDGTFLE